jgi:hypothetical protein
MSTFSLPHAVWLSAIVPGIGQFAQRRWLAGLFFLVTSLGLFGWITAVLIGAMVKNLQTALAFAGGDPSQPFTFISIQLVIGLLALFLAVYIAALFDAYLASLRLAKRPPAPPGPPDSNAR